MVRRHSSLSAFLPDHRGRVVKALGTDRLAQPWVVLGVHLAARQRHAGWAGRRVTSRPATPRLPMQPTNRICTAPNDGAIGVTNTAGYPPTDSGTPLPPRRPAAMSCNASPR